MAWVLKQSQAQEQWRLETCTDTTNHAKPHTLQFTGPLMNHSCFHTSNIPSPSRTS